jgi:hypothetical protein
MEQVWAMTTSVPHRGLVVVYVWLDTSTINAQAAEQSSHLATVPKADYTAPQLH